MCVLSALYPPPLRAYDCFDGVMVLSEMPSKGVSSSSSKAASMDCVEFRLAGGLALSWLVRGEEIVELAAVILIER